MLKFQIVQLIALVVIFLNGSMLVFTFDLIMMDSLSITASKEVVSQRDKKSKKLSRFFLLVPILLCQ